MAEVIVSTIVNQLAEITRKQIQEEVSLVRGVKKEILYLSSELKTIQNVLDDAERRGYKEKTIQHWLNELEDTSYDIADVLDEWNYVKLKLQIEGPDSVVVPLKVCPFIPSCLCVEKIETRRDIAKKIKKLKERMDMIVKKKARYDFIVARPVEPRTSDRGITTSFIEVSETQERPDDTDIVVRKLILEGADQEGRYPRVISIVGTGGIGKTTLAQLVYNDDQVINYFKKRIWICVSDVSDEVKIAKGIVEQVNGSAPNLNELESLLKCLADSISGKKFLLVLDDWESLKTSLKCGGSRSKLLMTTRSEMVAKKMGSAENEIHRMKQLSDDNCWLLMRQIAFFERREEEAEKFQDIGKNIAKKCKGLPLAAKVLGSHLRFKNTMEEWENVLNSDMWQLEKVELELFPHLSLSYNELSPAMKRCFSYCAIFPKDYEIDVEKLIRMWMAQGYLSTNGSSAGDLDLRGRDYFDILRMRSLFQEVGKSFGRVITCKMHDIIHDFAQFLRERKSQNMEGSIEATTKELSGACDPSLLTKIKVYRSLVQQYSEDLLTSSHLCKSLRVLKVGLQSENIETEIKNLIHLRYLDMDGRRLDRIPQTLFKLYNLETLYLNKLELREIPKEIGNLIRLTHLDLSLNRDIKELPETICNLHHLRTLGLDRCFSLERLPEGLDRLVNLTHLRNSHTYLLKQIPQGLEQLTGLRTLNCYNVGRSWCKWRYLNKLDKLSGYLELYIELHDTEDVNEAQKVKLRNKIDIQSLKFNFFSTWQQIDDITESVRNEILEALQPPPNLLSLEIEFYQGTKFPGWITSSLNHLKTMCIVNTHYCSALPPLGKLPGLELLEIFSMNNLEFLGREFLGIATSLDDDDIINVPPPLPSPSSSSSMVIGFPKLKELKISYCNEWKEWEDITAEEEGSATVSIMPCLEKLVILNCHSITVLPHRLLRKASSLQHLKISI
ncbi:hypothetical protein BUALT_Bualt07G0155100 [Buddleja alternifolia]|uniref:Uncharacterized protein n=1 Tax=Buddleja alternifolia TaxID=168488 RepID=A0AAV6XB19_9LAMI|nr:hypothetical protein BUALT_Bualt07G0155100 [Buddleja alternifolia]